MSFNIILIYLPIGLPTQNSQVFTQVRRRREPQQGWRRDELPQQRRLQFRAVGRLPARVEKDLHADDRGV